jgi:hypothetical protein
MNSKVIKNPTNYKTQGMAFSTLSFQKKDIDTDVFSDALTAGLRPVNCRPEFRGDEAFLEDVVGNLTQIIEMMFVQFDTLHGARVRCMVVKIDVTEPEASWYVLFRVRLTAEHKQLDTSNAHQRRASRRSLESCQHPARGGPRRGGLV